MPYQGTDRRAELKTLHKELAFTEKKLSQNLNSPGPRKVIERHIKQIRNDILHYGGNI